MTDMAEITREQVERLRAAVRAYIDGGEPVSEHALCTAFDEAREPISGNEPDYVIDAWHESGFEPFHAALTRWRDSLPVSKVARWDAERQRYILTPPATTSHQYNPSTADREQAIAWGYTIEGGPEVADDSPERLKARREALGWDLDDAADACTAAPGARWHTGNDIARLESREWPIDDAIKAARARYAAALSAEEQRRAAKPDPLAYADSPAFDEPAYSTLRQPAPDVVAVPQPVVKLSGDTEARWNGPGTILVRFTGPTYPGKASLTVPIPLLRAMLADIDAQQTDPQPDLDESPPPLHPEPARPEPRYKVGDWVRVTSVADGGDTSYVGVVFRVLSVFVSNGIDIYVSPKHGTWPVEHLTSALDPALHDTARKTVAWLRRGPCGNPPAHYYDLPGHAEYLDDTRAGDAERWAAQLELLLGDAP